MHAYVGRATRYGIVPVQCTHADPGNPTRVVAVTAGSYLFGLIISLSSFIDPDVSQRSGLGHVLSDLFVSVGL